MMSNDNSSGNDLDINLYISTFSMGDCGVELGFVI